MTIYFYLPVSWQLLFLLDHIFLIRYEQIEQLQGILDSFCDSSALLIHQVCRFGALPIHDL